MFKNLLEGCSLLACVSDDNQDDIRALKPVLGAFGTILGGSRATLAPLEAHRSAQDGFKLSVRGLNKAFLDVREAFKTSKMAIGAAFIPLMDRL